MNVIVKEVVPAFVGDIDAFPFDAMDDDVVRQLRAAWTKYPVLRLRNVHIDDAAQVAFSKALGQVFYSRDVRSGKHESRSEILVIANKKHADGTPAGDLGDAEVTWHTDHWWIEEPPSAAILRAVELPASGGNTYFANMYTAYRSLSDSTKSQLRGLYIHHQSVLDSFGELRRGMQPPSSPDFATWPGVDHPIVRRHVDSGKPCLYLGAARQWQSILGVDQHEANDLLDELWQHATDPDHLWYQEWKSGDMLIWDNRCLMHRRDSFDPRTTRVMHRTTAAGERPVSAL